MSNYITLQTKAGWSSYKEYDQWDEVLKLLEEEGITVVEVGFDWDKDIEALLGATIHVGVDSVFGHLAAAYGIPAVILFGSTDPKAFGHSSATNIQYPICGKACSIEDRFTNGNKYGQKCPYSTKCINLISPIVVFKIIKEKMKK